MNSTYPITVSNLPLSFELSLLVDILRENNIYASDLYKISENQAIIVFTDSGTAEDASSRLHRRKVSGQEILVEGFKSLACNDWRIEDNDLLLEVHLISRYLLILSIFRV